MVQPLWKTLWQFLSKLNTEVPYRSTPRHILKSESRCSNKNSYMNVHSSIIHNSQKMETTQMSIADEWVNKMWYIHTVEYYSASKRNEVLIHVAT